MSILFSTSMLLIFVVLIERTTISETHVPETQTKSAASVPQSQTNVYTITHVSSFDGVYDPVLTREGYRVGGLSRIVQYRTNKIFLLTGNLIRKSFASNRPNRLYVDQDILKFLAPDVFTLGEAEFQLLPEYYTFLKENTRIKVGCVNTNLESFAERMVKIKNTNIVVIGYIPTTFEGYVLATMEKLRVTDAIQAMRKQISDYNDNALFVAAGCAGIDFAIKIAEEVEGIDIVISGCSAHMQWNDGEPPESIPKYSDYPLRVTGKGGKSVLVAHSYGTTKFIGDLKVTVDSLGNVLNSTGNMVYLDHNYPENENMNAIVNQIRKVELARTRVFLNGKCNTKECNLGNVVADAFVMYKSELYTGEHWTDTPIGLVLSRNLRNNINASKTEDIILIDNVLYLFKPHHRLVTINVLGRDLLKVLEASIEQSEEYLGIFLQVSGLYIYYDETTSQRNKFVRLMVRCSRCKIPKFEHMNLREHYKIITTINVLDTSYEHNIFASLSQNVIIENTTDYHVLKEYLIRKKFIATINSERITVIRKSISSKVGPVAIILVVGVTITTLRASNYQN